MVPFCAAFFISDCPCDPLDSITPLSFTGSSNSSTSAPSHKLFSSWLKDLIYFFYEVEIISFF
jgi:hypothetical protein